jgi:hypothetical protein
VAVNHPAANRLVAVNHPAANSLVAVNHPAANTQTVDNFQNTLCRETTAAAEIPKCNCTLPTGCFHQQLDGVQQLSKTISDI